jgi:RecG-like helicase
MHDELKEDELDKIMKEFIKGKTRMLIRTDKFT